VYFKKDRRFGGTYRLPPASTGTLHGLFLYPKMVAISSSEMSGCVRIMRRYSAEDRTLLSHRRKNLRYTIIHSFILSSALNHNRPFLHLRLSVFVGSKSFRSQHSSIQNTCVHKTSKTYIYLEMKCISGYTETNFLQKVKQKKKTK
jgi:hypothetical protein